MKKEVKAADQNVVAALIINGDLGKLAPQEKVQYYNGYCERLGLDPFTKPFDLLRLNGREILYCTRSGAQQLNKLHGVSHAITSRTVIPDAGVYEVTAKASLPDGRYTESIGAVNITNLKGEAYANAVMKAETKAKRRATLDLLGLGVLDETEAESIMPKQQPKAVQAIPEAEEVTEEWYEEPTQDLEKSSRMAYTDRASLLATLSILETVNQLNNLYINNQKLVEAENLRPQFTQKKNMIQNANK
jgi:hypothetical protein